LGLEIVSTGSPKAFEEVVEGTYTRKIARFELILDSDLGTARVCGYKFALQIILAPLMAELK